jgi:hypothetical protein
MPKKIKALFAFKFVKLAGATQVAWRHFVATINLAPNTARLITPAFSRITFNILRRIKMQDFPVRDRPM